MPVIHRYRRRRHTTLRAGPNKGQQPEFFSDWPVLEAELKAYLAERQAGAPENVNEGQSFPRNAMLDFLSIDPTKMALEDEPDRVEWDGEVDVLAYSELTR